MPLARNEDEHRAWRLAAAYLGLVYLSLWPLQFALDALRVRNLLRISIVAVFAFSAAIVVVPMLRRRAGVREWLVLFAAGVVYALIASRMSIVQERLHLAEYGALALLYRRAIRARLRDAGSGWATATRVTIGALTLTSVSGLVDELIQGVLPNRQYDLRDVGFNALAGALALAAAAALDAARAADSGARGRDGWSSA